MRKHRGGACRRGGWIAPCTWRGQAAGLDALRRQVNRPAVDRRRAGRGRFVDHRRQPDSRAPRRQRRSHGGAAIRIEQWLVVSGEWLVGRGGGPLSTNHYAVSTRRGSADCRICSLRPFGCRRVEIKVTSYQLRIIITRPANLRAVAQTVGFAV